MGVKGEATTMDFNILATSERFTQSRAASELWMHLRAIGDENPKVTKLRINGIIKAKTSIPPLEAIEKLRKALHENPNHFKTLLRILPIQNVIKTDLEEIATASKEQVSIIPPDETYRITVEKRKTSFRSSHIIDSVAEVIDRKVNLENPDWVALVEVLGDYTGISIIPPSAILNVQKEKAAIFLRERHAQ